MSNYKPGDKVILGEHTNGYGFGVSMQQYVGKVATLTYKNKAGSKQSWYVDIDGGAYWWLEENFNQCPCKVRLCVKHRKPSL
jgi:hypothetical protein